MKPNCNLHVADACYFATIYGYVPREFLSDYANDLPLQPQHSKPKETSRKPLAILLLAPLLIGSISPWFPQQQTINNPMQRMDMGLQTPTQMQA